jgi:hypothetical protein
MIVAQSAPPAAVKVVKETSPAWVLSPFEIGDAAGG